MAAERDRLVLAMVALQLRPACSDEQLAQVLGLNRSFSAVFWKVKAQQFLEQGKVACEGCGVIFPASEGYYEPGEYAYCAQCCQW